MNKSVLRKYARLVVKMGVNVKKGQGVVLVAETDQAEFALLVAEEAYKAGAKWVDMQWSNQNFRKLQLRKESVRLSPRCSNGRRPVCSSRWMIFRHASSSAPLIRMDSRASM